MKKIRCFGVIVLIAMMLCVFVGCPGNTETPPAEYTISFDSDGGSDISSIKVKSGERVDVQQIPVPTKDGFVFLGWYDGNAVFNWAAPVTSDVTLRAKWEKISVDVPENPDETTKPEDKPAEGDPSTDTPAGPDDKPTKPSETAIAVTGVSLNKTDLDFKIGQAEQLTAIVEPNDATNKNVTWASSDETVVSVNQSGALKAKSKGQATITVQTEDGKFIAQCNVCVSEFSEGEEYYTVKYFYENIDDSDYIENEDERKTVVGIIGVETTENAAEVEGFSTPVITQVTVVENAENVVSVKYARKVITLKFDLDGGTGTESISGKYGANLTKPSNPAKTGYTFIGWNTELPSILTENATYKATWIPNSLGITVTLPQKSEVAKLEYSISENIVTIAAESGHSTYSWFIDMEKQNETSGTLRINAADLRSGFYSVMVVIDGKYSSTVTVAIDN